MEHEAVEGQDQEEQQDLAQERTAPPLTAQEVVDRVLERLARRTPDDLRRLAATWKAADERRRSSARANARAAARSGGLADDVRQVQEALQDWARRSGSGASSAGLWGQLRDTDNNRARMLAFPAVTDAAVALLLADVLAPSDFNVLTDAWRLEIIEAEQSHGVPPPGE